MATKKDYLKETIKHIDIKEHNVIPLVDAMGGMAFSARTLNRAANIYNTMLGDEKCSIILTLAGSLFSAGLKKVVYDLVMNNMVDAIVSTGAIIVDQDFFEALGYKHYKGTQFVNDNEMRELMIDRIYDTFIDEEELRICDDTTAKIADSLEPRPYSSREFIYEMGKYLEAQGGPKVEDSVIWACYKKNVPIFVPAFSDCSAGFGLLVHQTQNPTHHVSIDSAKDFLELTKIKIACKETGIFMIGGGVPKNFTQDIVVAADILQEDASMHKYAVQITVADERDGALSGSTLKEASSWGKVETTFEQMVYAEATIAMPLVVGYAYHKGAWKKRKAKEFQKLYAPASADA
ncbi:MAG: deoxyhypusine synthase [Ignavibacteria bacterium CG2_30_36_16]|nr:deoxyhypusine synthase [Ignavibacteria bacterium]OIP55388.1 MAG: deoxyhypusine synthase [Ignavibacteria bacterium CG2_30_36_16]PJB02392.1 MAG: deoxyhypusine synthase [Ignavibacteria bacterium CG_4_9_14_3_um_filter_36_18]